MLDFHISNVLLFGNWGNWARGIFSLQAVSVLNWKYVVRPKNGSWPANFVFWYYWESDWDCFLVWHVSHFFKVCMFDLDISALWSEILNICKVAFEFKPSNDLGMALTWNSPNQLEEHFLTFNEALWKRGMKNIFKNSLIRFSILVDCA